MKRVVLSCLIILSCALGTSAQSKETVYGIGNHLGVGVGVGTEGISIDAAVCFSKYLSARVGVNMMPNFEFKDDIEFSESFTYNPGIPGVTPQTVNHEGFVTATAGTKRTTVDVKLDFYPFPEASSFFISGGLSFGGKQVISLTGEADAATKEWIDKGQSFGIDLDGYELLIDNDGTVSATAEVKNVRPYLGLGFGRAIPKGRLGLRFEAGVQFQQKPQLLDADGKDLLETVGNLDKNTSNTISDVLDYMQVYPCIKLSLRGRIF